MTDEFKQDHKAVIGLRQFARRWFWLLLVPTFVCLPACSATDPEYSQKLAMARSDGTGKEIVGVWVSKLNSALPPTRFTLLFRPDGTGRLRATSLGTTVEDDTHWQYAGQGIWKGRANGGGMRASRTMTMRGSGAELLVEQTDGVVTTRQVFVRGDNETLVDEYLKKR